MKIWAISDLHLPGEREKTMNQFGAIWANHPAKIVNNWRSMVDEDDIVIIAGDLTWATQFDSITSDLNLISALPGQQKILIRGNHDYWWKKHKKILKSLPNRIKTLCGDAIKIQNQIFCGTRGWISPSDPCSDPLDNKTFQKEMKQLEMALDAAILLQTNDEAIHVVLHFPPFTTAGKKTQFFDLLCRYRIDTCTYGHFHMQEEWEKIPKGLVNGINFILSSTDYLAHKPVLIWEQNQ